MTTDYPSHIAGARTAVPGAGDRSDNVNPATGAVLGTIHHATTADVDAAVAAAQAAQPAWAALTGAARGRILKRTADILRRDTAALARLEVLDTGKPISEALAVDVSSAADCLEFFGGLAAAVQGEHIPLGSSAFAYTRREPLGVCAGIGAWNYPLQIAAWKAAPALAMGNAMIFKPSDMTPATALALAEAFAEAGLPAGLYSVVQGDGRIGAALATHPDIAKVSVTGSVPTGHKVMAGAAETLKHVTMELGGKSALIVFEDADLENAVAAALMANFYTQGEVCTNGTRVFVAEALHDRFLARLVERTAKLVVGDPLDPATHVGALISAAHMDKVLGFIETGTREGAELAIGGKRRTDGALAAGNFVEPTVFARCRDGMTIVGEEIFGPVLSLLTFREEAEVVARANATPFGLAAGLMTRDLARAHRVAAALEAGVVWVNDYNLTPIEMPFGGVKRSGIGRENGLAALDAYSERKSVYVSLGDVDCPYPT
ncbi:MAG: betaine-aldehyde dehydrogenase [Rhodospirillaceae bacterium]|nr:betaine-aldehyde dehydrogenase [Rhodospirillaceae bacterium]